ncbi:MAG: NUDIX hydrolase [Archangiaceae bacterium]|nr:NUDIX hydrolase [Archangiaceae bacterium]
MASTREFSSGGIVIRERNGVVEVAVIRPAGKTVTALPKGHIDPGENAEQAATREVNEETGLTATLEQKLGDVKYVYRWRGNTIFKEVEFFLFRYVSGEIDVLTEQMRKEVDRAYWIPLDEALTKLTYPGERDMANRAKAALAVK